jgi:hypothetical protein
MQITEDALFARLGRQQIELELLREQLALAETNRQRDLEIISDLTDQLKPPKAD